MIKKVEDYKKLFNIKEMNAEWEEGFYDSAWEPNTLQLTQFEEQLIKEFTGALPRHMSLYDWNLPYAEGCVLIIRRLIQSRFNNGRDEID